MTMPLPAWPATPVSAFRQLVSTDESDLVLHRDVQNLRSRTAKWHQKWDFFARAGVSAIRSSNGTRALVRYKDAGMEIGEQWDYVLEFRVLTDMRDIRALHRETCRVMYKVGERIGRCRSILRELDE